MSQSDISAGIEEAKRPVAKQLIVVVVALSILTFLGTLSETSLNIAYSVLMEEFSISASVVQWLTTGYLLLLSVAIPTSTYLVRRFPTKGLFVTSLVIFTAGTVLGAVAINFPMLLAARLIMALGTGISLPLLTNIILEKAPLEQRGMLLGLVSLVTCAAPAVGPVFGGIVMEYLNWHWIFYIMLPFLVLSFVMGSVTVPDIRKGEKAYISIPSLLLVAIGLAALIIAVSFFSDWNGDWRVWGTLLACVAALAVFAVMQVRIEHPLINIHAFTYPGFTLGIFILMMSNAGVLGLNFMLPILMQRGFDLSSMNASLVLLPGAVVGAVAAPLIGSALKQHYPPKFILFGFICVALLDLVFIFGANQVWIIAVVYALYMGFSGFVLVPDQTHALNQLPARLNADGSAILNTFQQMAGAIGTAVASTLIAEYSASALNEGLSQETAYLQAFPESMRVFLGAAIIGLLLAVAMAKFSTRRPPEMIEV